MCLERSCGAVVFTRVNGEIRYVVVTEKEGAHSYPKGHMEGNETEEETASREVYEEIGLRPRFIPGFRQEDAQTLYGVYGKARSGRSRCCPSRKPFACSTMKARKTCSARRTRS